VSQHGGNCVCTEGVLFILGLFYHNAPVDFDLTNIHVMLWFYFILFLRICRWVIGA